MSRILSNRWEVLSDGRGSTRPSEMMVFHDEEPHSGIYGDMSRIQMFKLDLTMRTSREDRPYCVAAAKLKGSGELVPISGFPATLQELKERCQKQSV